MSNKFHRPRTGLLIPKGPKGGPKTTDPTVTRMEVPTIGVVCPRPKGNGTDQCPNGGENLPIKSTDRVGDDRIRFGFHCDGCGYESEMVMESRHLR